MSISLDKNLLAYQYYENSIDKEDINSVSKLLNGTIVEEEMMNLILKSEQSPMLKRLVSSVIKAKAKTNQYLLVSKLNVAINSLIDILENSNDENRLKAISKLSELYNLTKNIYDSENSSDEIVADTVSYIQKKIKHAKKVTVYEPEETDNNQIDSEDSD